MYFRHFIFKRFWSDFFAETFEVTNFDFSFCESASTRQNTKFDSFEQVIAAAVVVHVLQSLIYYIEIVAMVNHEWHKQESKSCRQTLPRWLLLLRLALLQFLKLKEAPGAIGSQCQKQILSTNISILLWNKELWLVILSHMAIFNQSEC